MTWAAFRALHSITKFVFFAVMAITLASCSRVSLAPVFFGNGQSVNEVHGGRSHAGSGPYQVTVRRGDTLSEIALRHDVPTRTLARANNIRAPFTIFPGQAITVPSSPTHRVARGESLSQIAARYNVEMNELARANHIRRPNRIYAGQEIELPWGSTETRPTRRPAMALNRSGSTRNRLGRGASRPRAQRAAPAPRRVTPVPASAVSARDLTPPRRSGQGFMWPVDGRIVSEFGPKGGGQHNDGINISVPVGTPVRAADSGVVIYVGNEVPGFGNLVLIRHASSYVTAYAHNSRLDVHQGDVVERGEIVALSGRTGRVSEPQLHFEVRRNSRAVNPSQFLAGA